MSDEQKKERYIISSIVKKSSDKTAVVMIERQLRHPFYGKYITRSSKLHIHDENNEAQVGDLVKIIACPRKSKTKAWRLVEVLQRASTETLASAEAKQTKEVKA